ncbi:MAG: AAA family ATPase [Desulfitobacteriaceae bacterium]|nr:AAA family ATPase [Desulfitobacteriaceae bacterium]MDD4401914.1 AAA family ATPase [Desulfitobacteriaceae bacterium]
MLINLAIGTGIGIFTYLFVMGYNVMPLGLLFVSIFLVWKLIIQRQLVRTTGKGVIFSNSAIRFDDIGGQNTAKKELQEALDFLCYSERMKVLGIRPMKGILLSGPPGTGKTLLAKAAACYTDSAFISISGSEFVEMYAGVGAERVRNLFRRAREMAGKEKKNSAIIFIDEMDILGVKRGGNVSHHEYDQTLNQLLVEMDGLGTDQGPQILVIAATNRAEALDQALLRPGRFDRQVKVDLPDKGGRLAILNIHLRNKPLAKDIDLERIAQETFGFSGAHLENVTNEVAVLALRENVDEITEKHLREAIDKVMLGERLDRKPNHEELHRIALHEGGHALIAELVRPNSVAQISIRSRGSALGYVRHYPKDDNYLYTKVMLDNQIMVALAGAVAEEVVLGTRSTGAASDYEQVLNLIEKILQSGMSSLGVVDSSKISKEQRYNIIQEIIGDLETRTKQILIEKKTVLIEITELLEKEESIEGGILRKYLQGVA